MASQAGYCPDRWPWPQTRLPVLFFALTPRVYSVRLADALPVPAGTGTRAGGWRLELVRLSR